MVTVSPRSFPVSPSRTFPYPFVVFQGRGLVLQEKAEEEHGGGIVAVNAGFDILQGFGEVVFDGFGGEAQIFGHVGYGHSFGTSHEKNFLLPWWQMIDRFLNQLQ